MSQGFASVKKALDSLTLSLPQPLNPLPRQLHSNLGYVEAVVWFRVGFGFTLGTWVVAPVHPLGPGSWD